MLIQVCFCAVESSCVEKRVAKSEYGDLRLMMWFGERLSKSNLQIGKSVHISSRADPQRYGMTVFD